MASEAVVFGERRLAGSDKVLLAPEIFELDRNLESGDQLFGLFVVDHRLGHLFLLTENVRRS